MKKATRLISILLLTVLVIGVLSGCASFGKNTTKYRAQTALTVGNQKITIGKIVDTFNNYYNSYYSYISQGYVTADSLFSMAISSLYTQYMKVDSYIANNADQVYSHSLSSFCNYANYLTEDEMKYVISYIKYLIFTNYDSAVESQLEADYNLGDETESEDTSRDFTEYDDWDGTTTYNAYLLSQNFKNEDMDEYFANYYGGSVSYDVDVASYIYENADAAAKRIADYNARIDDEDDKLTFESYKEIQQNVYNKYNKSIESSYGIKMDAFVKNQIEDAVVSCLVNKYNSAASKDLETTAQLESVFAALNDNYAKDKSAQAASFNFGTEFTSFIEGLSDGNYIYNVPADYKYIFVKNILVPFTDAQKAALTNYANSLGITESSLNDCDDADRKNAYIAYRNKIASEIVAEKYTLSEGKFVFDDEGEFVTTKENNLFALDASGKLVMGTNTDSDLVKYLNGGNVTAISGKTKTETIVELMKEYNTDTAQHTAAYDYVVRIDAPEDYEPKWVSEFVAAAEEAYTTGKETYALCVSSYGVHIVYYTDDVTEFVPDFATNYNKTNTLEYKLFKAYYETKADEMLEDAVDSLEKNYFVSTENSKPQITATKVFDNFVKDQGFTFDFTKSITVDED